MRRYNQRNNSTVVGMTWPSLRRSGSHPVVCGLGDGCREKRMEQDDPTSSTEAPGVTVPAVPADVATEHKDVWEAYQRLGEAISAAGPLDARSRRLVHLA